VFAFILRTDINKTVRFPYRAVRFQCNKRQGPQLLPAATDTAVMM
jgi:V8-like Glu-specific endopeptidase